MMKPTRLIAKMWDSMLRESVSTDRMFQELRWDY
jgi:hypothetical protein